MAACDPRWESDRQGRKTWPVNGYAVEGERRTDWFAPNILKYHRMLGTTPNILLDAGFSLRRVEGFTPTDERIAAQPTLAEERERPMLPLLSARCS